MVDRIDIQGLVVECVVGVYPAERDTPQPLIVDVHLVLDLSTPATRDELAYTVDYSALAQEMSFILRYGRFHLLEAAANALCRYLLLKRMSKLAPSVLEVTVELTKPNALDREALPRVCMQRKATDVQFVREYKPFGTVDVVIETSHTGLYRLNVAPQQGIPLHIHRVMDESEFILTDGLLCQNKPVAAGTIFHWPKEHPHRYDNPSGRTQSILCIDRPAFIAEDEVAHTLSTHEQTLTFP